VPFPAPKARHESGDASPGSSGFDEGSEGGKVQQPPLFDALDSSGGIHKAMPPVKLAHCCCPIPGDAIVGLFIPGKGMIVHRSDCRTLRRYGEQARERYLDVNWLQIEPQLYLAPITIVARDRAGLLRDVAAVVSDAGINMTAVTSTSNASAQKAVITATLEIEAVEQIDRIFKRLRQVKNVVSVNRSLSTKSAPAYRSIE
ncbi:MAG TPA: ACT domain-containing protein, partial [Ktedonobacteraceae bacterium]